MQTYGIYKNIRDNAWKCLIDFKIDKLPVDVLKIADEANVTVIKNSSVGLLRAKEYGRSYYDGKHWYIVYDDSAPVECSRFTVAHELGHYFLGHQLQYVKYSRIREVKKVPVSEKQANRFAARLLCPACVLWKLNINTAEELASVCKVDISVAQIRMKRLKELRNRNKFFTSPLEKEMFSMFEEYLERENRSFF